VILWDAVNYKAKITTLLTGLSGFYLLYVLDGWHRYAEIGYWWIHAMTLIWGIFTLVLFVLEPRFLHRWFRKQSEKEPVKTFALNHRFLAVLLALSLLTIAGAVAGSHGWFWFWLPSWGSGSYTQLRLVSLVSCRGRYVANLNAEGH